MIAPGASRRLRCKKQGAGWLQGGLSKEAPLDQPPTHKGHGPRPIHCPLGGCSTPLPLNSPPGPPCAHTGAAVVGARWDVPGAPAVPAGGGLRRPRPASPPASSPNLDPPRPPPPLPRSCPLFCLELPGAVAEDRSPSSRASHIHLRRRPNICAAAGRSSSAECAMRRSVATAVCVSPHGSCPPEPSSTATTPASSRSCRSTTRSWSPR